MASEKVLIEQRDSLIFILFAVGIFSSILSYFGFKKLFFKAGTVEDVYKQVCFCRSCKQKSKVGRSPKKSYKVQLLIFSAISWCLFAFIMVKIYQYPSEMSPIMDPYEILGVEQDSSKNEIKKAYRKLALKKHPDHGGKPEEFHQLTQAYQILTDPDSLEHWLKYGKSDGPVDREYGIALPTWLLTEATSPTFVLLYYLVALLSIPLTAYYFYKRWFASNSNSVAEDIKPMLHFIFSCLFWSPSSSFKKMMVYFSATPVILGYKESREQFTRCFTKEIDYILRNLKQEFEVNKTAPFDEPVSIEFRLLFQAYLERMNIQNAQLVEYQDRVVNQCKVLINMTLYSFIEYGSYICQQRKNKSDPQALLSTFKSLVLNLPCVVQACTVYDNPLIQLPYVTNTSLNSFLRKKKGVTCIEDFVKLNERTRRMLLEGLNDEEMEDFYLALKAIPTVRFHARFRVDNDDETINVTTNSNVFVDFCVKRESIGKYLHENAVESVTNNKKGQVYKRIYDSDFVFPPSDKIKPWAYVFGNKKRVSYEAHCPHFSERVAEKWWIYTVDTLSNALMTPVICFDTYKDEMCFSCNLGQLPVGIHVMTYILASGVYIMEQTYVKLKIDVKNEAIKENSSDVSDLSSDGYVDYEVISNAE